MIQRQAAKAGKRPALSDAEKNYIRRKRRKKFKQFFPLYLMLLPGLIYLIVNNYLPMGGLVIAFKKIDYSLGIFASPWVGLQNFKFLFSNQDALKALRNTISCSL